MNDQDIKEVYNLREFKSKLFDLYWEHLGSFYIHVLPHTLLKIGNRGLLNKEVTDGIILNVSNKSVKEVKSYSDTILLELQFGSKWEKCIIPWDCIVRIFDKYQNSANILKCYIDTPISIEDKEEIKKEVELPSNVIKVDFSKKR